MNPKSTMQFATVLACAGILHVSSASAATEKVLHSFGNGSDGVHPWAGLINVKGTLYGTTEGGGASDNGTVFSVKPSGTEKVLYSFKGGSYGDGAYPAAGLISVNGTLYGTTEGGGASGRGAVFSVTPKTGTDIVLHSFSGYPSDGDAPETGLISVNGTLYGTTYSGGASSDNGTVFSVKPRGKEKVVYSFKGDSYGDGAYPSAGLINVNGTQYGTTGWGGGTGCFSSEGCGTVFSITPNGTEKVLYRFKGGSDGAGPAGDLIKVKGLLYGTTVLDGDTGCNGDGCGTVFSITPNGTEKVLYRFKGGSDGSWPMGLTGVGGTLYGTTSGQRDGSAGTVFSIKP